MQKPGSGYKYESPSPCVSTEPPRDNTESNGGEAAIKQGGCEDFKMKVLKVLICGF